MKTIIMWEPEDIIVGRWYFRMGSEKYNPENISYYISTAHIIGYDSAILGEDKFTFTSLSDGMVGMRMSKNDMVHMLNKGKYIPLPLEILIELIKGKFVNG